MLEVKKCTKCKKVLKDKRKKICVECDLKKFAMNMDYKK